MRRSALIILRIRDESSSDTWSLSVDPLVPFAIVEPLKPVFALKEAKPE